MISLLCPTRGRPENVFKQIKQFRETQKEKNEFLFYIQNDDEKKNEYIKVFKQLNHNDYIIDDFTFTGHMWNKLADIAKGDILMLMGDDAEIVTKDWDIKMKESVKDIKDNIYILGVVDEKGSCPFPAMHKDLKKILNYFHPPMFLHRYGDTYLCKLGIAVNRFIICKDILFKHPKAIYATDNTVKKSRQWINYDKYNSEHSNRYFDLDVKLMKENIR